MERNDGKRDAACFHRFRRWLATAALLAAIAWIGSLLPQPMAVSQDDDQNDVAGSPDTIAIGINYGTFSCAAAACHGSTMPDPRALDSANAVPAIRRDELVQWVTNDPHAKSRRVMESQRWKTILETLRESSPDVSADRSCLPCHGMQYVPRRSQADNALETTYLDGVGCESCHGPSSGWIGVHFRDEFKSWTPEQKKRAGFFDTTSLWSRAEQCIHCHVAHPDAQVNHAIIAAGHPRLQFDFATYFARLPAHWNQTKEIREQGGADQYWQRLWVVGRMTEALAATQQLVRCTDGSAGEQPWPEFSAYDCYACHHSLDATAAWRRDRVWQEAAARNSAEHPRVVIPPSRWPFETVSVMAAAGQPEVQASLDKLYRVLASRLVPDRAAVQAAAKESRDRLSEWTRAMQQSGANDADVAQLVGEWDKLFRPESSAKLVHRWDNAVQGYWYLALIDRQQRLQSNGAYRPANGEIRKRLEQLEELLMPKLDRTPTVDSPVGFSGGLSDDAESSPRRQTQVLLEEVFRLLAETK